MEWKIELIGNKEILNHLLNDNEDINIEDGKYILRYKTNLNYKSKDVEKEIDEYLRKINSYLEIAFNYPDNKIDYESFYFIDENGHKHESLKTIVVHVGVHANIMSQKVTRLGVTTETYKPLSKLKDWVELTQKDEHVQRVSDILNDEKPSYMMLSKILDVLKDDVFINELEKSKDDSINYKDELSRFRNTANSYAATKEGSRHAKKLYTPPAIPMPLNEARNLFNKILDYWIEYKMKKLNN